MTKLKPYKCVCGRSINLYRSDYVRDQIRKKVEQKLKHLTSKRSMDVIHSTLRPKKRKIGFNKFADKEFRKMYDKNYYYKRTYGEDAVNAFILRQLYVKIKSNNGDKKVRS